jgi:hypothetical protein
MRAAWAMVQPRTFHCEQTKDGANRERGVRCLYAFLRIGWLVSCTDGLTLRDESEERSYCWDRAGSDPRGSGMGGQASFS